MSRATVSRVVNGGYGVRESLAERVRRAVEELGCVPNQAARSLVTTRVRLTPARGLLLSPVAARS